ncbi:hypothetical protein, partial [Salmonella enterica]|uniref:hypothetical protein n=1 Tax=Salmonella enterica TaxID=28901 RepID=UPI001BB0803B
SITRGEAAVILDNAFNISQADVSNSNQTMTRAEFAVVLAQTLYSETQVSADNQTDQPEGNGSVETSSENETAAGEST